MKRNLILFIFLCTMLWVLKAKAEGPIKKTVEIIIGISYTEMLDFVPSTQLIVGDTSKISYIPIPQKKRITFNGLKTGQTSVQIMDTAGNIKREILFTITENSKSKLLQKLRAYLGDIEGIEIGIKGGRVYVGGQIVVPGDIGRIVVVLNEFDNDIIRLVELSPHTQQVIAKKMEEEIHKNHMNQVQVRVVNKAFWLEGVVNSKAEKERAFRIANAYMPDKIESLASRTNSVAQVQGREWIQDFISISSKKPPQPVPKMIKITAQFVELTKDYMRTFGFKWSPTLSTGGSIEFGKTTKDGVTTRGTGTLSGVISNLFPKLASAKNAGHARVIQQGVVLAQNGVQATISKGSTKRYTAGTGEFTKDGVAEAGFNVKVVPTIMQNENIQLRTGIEVSSNVGEPPETLKNTISTTVVVKSKESAVIGGVVINKSSTAYDKDPPFGKSQVDPDNPDASTLFSFLRSKSYLSSKSQFVIFITPEIVESASTGTEAVKRKFRRRRR